MAVSVFSVTTLASVMWPCLLFSEKPLLSPQLNFTGEGLIYSFALRMEVLTQQKALRSYCTMNDIIIF